MAAGTGHGATQLVIVCGLSSSGKTTFATRLANGYGVRFSPDERMAAFGIDLFDGAMRHRVEQLQWQSRDDSSRSVRSRSSSGARGDGTSARRCAKVLAPVTPP